MEGVPLREIVVEMKDEMNQRFDKVDTRLAHIEKAIPQFVTWAKLGGAIATVAGLVIALFNLTT